MRIVPVTCVAILGMAGLLAFAWAGSAIPRGAEFPGRGPRPGGARPPVAQLEASCKPQGPVRLDLLLVGGSGPAAAPGEDGPTPVGAGAEGPLPQSIDLDVAGEVEVEFGLQPLLDFEALDWEWQLTPGVVLVRGAPMGDAAPGRARRTTGTLRLRPPAAITAGAPPAQARLVVTGRFRGRDAAGGPSDEVVVVTRGLRWGDPSVDAPVFEAADREGPAQPFVAVPSTTRPGR